MLSVFTAMVDAGKGPCQNCLMIPQSRFISTLTLALLVFLSACVLPVAAAEHTVAPSGAEFVSIQDAVDWASPGDTIFVESGTYFETVILNKKILLMGIDRGGEFPVIDVGGTGNGLDIRVDGCTVEGFVIRNGSLFTGIRVASSDNTLRKNTIRDFDQGIWLLSSQRSTIAENNITENDRAGIMLEASNTNDIENNIVTKNTLGIALDEYSLSNRINRNSFINNQNVISKSATSQWNLTGYPVIHLSRPEGTEPDGQLLERLPGKGPQRRRDRGQLLYNNSRRQSQGHH